MSLSTLWRKPLAKRALTRIASKIHPDLFGNDGLEEQRKKNSVTFQSLSDLINQNSKEVVSVENGQEDVKILLKVDAWIKTGSEDPSRVKNVVGNVTKRYFNSKEYKGIDENVLIELEQRSVVASLWKLCELLEISLTSISANVEDLVVDNTKKRGKMDAQRDLEEYYKLLNKVNDAKEVISKSNEQKSMFLMDKRFQNKSNLRVQFQKLMKKNIDSVKYSNKY